jgi:oligogalacturonide lyase
VYGRKQSNFEHFIIHPCNLAHFFLAKFSPRPDNPSNSPNPCLEIPMRVAFFGVFLFGVWAIPARGQAPTDWIDPATGHRIIRLSKDPGTSSWYFHQQSYTEKGDKLVVSVKGGFAAIDLTTLGTTPPKIEQIVQGGGGNAIVGKKSRQVYYARGGTFYATHIDTKVTREIGKLPAPFKGGSGLAVNADETLLATTCTDPDAKSKAKGSDADSKDSFFPKGQPTGKLIPGGRSLTLITVNIKTGAVKPVHSSTDWLNHIQFSPTDPQQILFCHEGTWDFVNRVWTIRADGTGLKLMHKRTMVNEIAGHEYFSSDGKMILYDLQTPRSSQFWLASVNIQTGERIRHKVERSQWSVHYNQSHDGKLYSGDGGGPNSVANRAPKGTEPLKGPGNGQWIYLFTPDQKYEMLKVGGEEVKVGTFSAEKLVDLSKHDYASEPNATFTPDDKWLVFRSNMHGAGHVYAVEVKKANGK